MSDVTHSLIPFAARSAAGYREAARTMQLPQLQRLLGRLVAGPLDAGTEDSLSMPHERALARALGLPVVDGLIPFTAWQLEQQGRDTEGTAWAIVTPCHWRVGRDHVAMVQPGRTALTEADSRALVAAMHPYFEQDGLRLEYDAPQRWIAGGEVFRKLAAASLDRVAGQMVDTWLPRGDEARTIRRLQQEMQMLLYTHPVNEERARTGLLPVNSFWVSATGALPDRVPREAAGLRVEDALKEPALADDVQAWRDAWEALDGSVCAALAQALDRGAAVQLTLCGERSSRTWSTPVSNGMAQKLGRLFARIRTTDVLETL